MNATKVTIECPKCGKLLETDAFGIIKSIIDCVENGRIYGGHFCEECYRKDIAENFCDDGEN